MKIAAIIPTRGDRQQLLQNCLRLCERQTHKFDEIILMDEPPLSPGYDITYRYRKGYEMANQKGVDLVFLIEDDDWYSEKYVETMLQNWQEDKPDILGIQYTVYYHLKLQKYKFWQHLKRASAMSTVLKSNLDIHWPVDNEPYLDIHLWMQNKHLSKKLITPEIISVGIKHGMGVTIAKGHHTGRFNLFDTDDMGFLQKTVDPESFEFYLNLNL